MILHNNVGRVTIGTRLIFILRDYLSLGIILLVLVAFHMFTGSPILMLKIHIYLLFYVWDRCER